jgi:pimeloyl-ACP methyl ester carboxylesterase
MKHLTLYRTVQVDGLSIFYREAGPKDAPTILLLHGLPSSSRMFAPLFTRLSDRYHLVAPDYPGFGHSDWPDPKKFAYTFDHIAEIMNHFTEACILFAWYRRCRSCSHHFNCSPKSREEKKTP